jgi:hypothetical protein
MAVKFFVALLAVAALVAGCGGSSGGSSTSSSQAAGSNGGSSTGSSSSAASTSSSAPTTSASTPTFASNSNCQSLANMARKYVAELQASVAGGGQVDFTTLLKADQAMADASPSDIHSDAEYVVHTFAGFLTAMSKVGFKPGAVPTASQIAALAPLETQIKSAQFTGAVNHIKAWIHANCHGVT